MAQARHREPGVYVLRRKSDGAPLYVGTTGDLSKRLLSHARESSILGRAGIPWSEIDALQIPLPHAGPAMLSVIEVALIGGIGRVADGTGTLLNRDGGGGGGHALSPAELTARALKARKTRQLQFPREEGPRDQTAECSRSGRFPMSEQQDLPAMLVVRCPHDLDPLMRAAGGLWEPGGRRWLFTRNRVGPLMRNLRRATDPLFRQAGIDLDGEGDAHG